MSQNIFHLRTLCSVLFDFGRLNNIIKPHIINLICGFFILHK